MHKAFQRALEDAVHPRLCSWLTEDEWVDLCRLLRLGR